jgi:hypothetical protein
VRAGAASAPHSALAQLRDAFTARFDEAALRAPPWDTLPPAVAAKALDALRAWCLDGIGSGARPLMAPSAASDVTVPFRAAVVTGENADAAVLALGLQLDGSLRLQQMGRFAGIAWRLAVKLHDAMWWRGRQPSDPWDFGFLRDDGDAAIARFTPRRATLIAVAGADPVRVNAQLALLQSRAPALERPVRVLLTGCALEGVEHIPLD